MSECSYCEKEAMYVDTVWGPPLCRVCNNPACVERAKDDLFEAAMEDCS